MIVCRKCGRRYANGTEFCACGAFLEFDGEYVEDRTVLAEDPKDGERGNGPQPSIFLSDRRSPGSMPADCMTCWWLSSGRAECSPLPSWLVHPVDF